MMVCGEWLTWLLAVFEGAAHPYKQNILKIAGQQASSIRDLPEVKETLAASR